MKTIQYLLIHAMAHMRTSNGRRDGRADGRTNRQADGQTYEWTDRYTGGRMGGHMNGQMNRHVDGQMNGSTCRSLLDPTEHNDAGTPAGKHCKRFYCFS